jgi:uncharacterized delta-60 repeat protein
MITTIRVLFAITFVMLVATAVYPGGAGSVDLTFNNGAGYKLDGFGAGDDWGQKAVVQPDGKIVVVGYTYRASVEHSDVALARYNADGTLDLSFGDGGKEVTTVNERADQALSVALQADGKIVIAGFATDTYGEDFLVARYTANGKLDLSFGLGGKVITPITVGFTTSQDRARDVAIQPDGKIVAAGTAGLYSAIVRYNSNGSLDGTFGGGVITVAPVNGMQIFALAIQPDGKVITAGSSEEGFALLRYNADGSPDSAFDVDGAVITHFSDRAVAYSVTLQPDGKIVAGGSTVTGAPEGDFDFAIARYNTDGSLDSGFDGDGKFTADFRGEEQLNSVAIQPDGKIVGVGTTGLPISSVAIRPEAKSAAAGAASSPDGRLFTFAAIRCNSDGTLDSSFGGTGKISTILTGDDFYGFDEAQSAALQPDGKIVAVGITRYGGDNFALVRYNSDGTLDGGFDGDGKISTDVGNSIYQGTDIIVQPDGKILTSVYGMGGGLQFALIRYNPDGTPDLSFGALGKVRTPFPSSFTAVPNQMLLQPDGKIVVAGTENQEFQQRIALARYNSDGSLDTTFDGDGLVITAVFGGGPCGAYAMAIGPDGKITINGSAYNFPESRFYTAIVRYNTNGSLDTSFDGDGILTSLTIPGGKMIIQPDGKMVIGSGAFTLTRLNTNGSFDTSFGTGGTVSTSMGGTASLSQLVLMPDGRILAGGNVNSGSSSDFALARYNSDGSLDTSFDGDGKVIASLTAVNDVVADILIQADGKIVAGGYSSTPDDIRDLALARFNPDGSLDSSYGAGGKSVIDTGYTADFIAAMALDSTGKAVITGVSYNFFVARIMADAAPLADIIGRVTAPNGQGIGNISMVLTNEETHISQYAITSPFGYYVFSNLPSNGSYTVSTSSKRYSFAPESQTFSLIESVSNIDFVGTANNNGRIAVKGAAEHEVRTGNGSDRVSPQAGNPSLPLRVLTRENHPVRAKPRAPSFVRRGV